MVTLRQLRSLTISFLAALFAVALAGGPALAADVTTPFAGKAVNGGTVTHEHRDGRHISGSPTTSRSRARRIRTGRSWTARATSTC
jgi:hypothetical protein